jgi:hypothetical protein
VRCGYPARDTNRSAVHFNGEHQRQANADAGPAGISTTGARRSCAPARKRSKGTARLCRMEVGRTNRPALPRPPRFLSRHAVRMPGAASQADCGHSAARRA